MNQFIQDAISKGQISYRCSNFLTFGFANCMMTATTLTTYLHLLRKTVGKDALEIIKAVSAAQLKAMAHHWFPKGIKTNHELDRLLQCLEMYGYGAFSIEHNDPTRKETILKQKNSVICKMNQRLFGKDASQINAFGEGLSGGVGECLHANVCDSQEIQCICNHKDACLLKTTKSEKSQYQSLLNYQGSFSLMNVPKEGPSKNVSMIQKVQGHQMLEWDEGMMSLMKIPGVIIPTNSLACWAHLFQETGYEEANRLLYHCAHTQSKEAVAVQVKRFGFKPDRKLFDSVLEHIGMTGYGLAEIEELNFEKKTATIKVNFNSMPLQLKKQFGVQDKGVDYYLAGLCSGMCEGFFEEKVSIAETKCVARGDSLCLFEITAASKGHESYPIPSSSLKLIEEKVCFSNFML